MNRDEHFEGSVDPFPRKDLTQRIGQAARFERVREGWQLWLFGLGVTLVALAFPMERLWGHMDLVRLAAEGGRGIGVGVPLLRLGAKWMSHEQAGYTLAAISAGLTLPALRALLVTIGFAHPLAIRSVWIAILAPLALLGASTPVLLAPGILGATLLARELFRLRKDRSMRALWRVSSVFLLALLLDPANLLLLPAAALALVPLATARRIPPWTLPASLVATIGYCVWILLSAGDLEASDQLLEAMLAGGRGASVESLGSWLIWLPLSLGAGWLGIFALLGGRRTAEESPPPTWVRAWCLMALAPIIGGDPWALPALGLLLPLCTIGIADHLGRMDEEFKILRRTRVLLLVQLALGAAVILGLYSTDPLSSWRHQAQQSLNPGDHVLSQHPGHLYLLRHRYGVTAEDPDDPGATQRALKATEQGRRLVLDGALTNPSAALESASSLTIAAPGC